MKRFQTVQSRFICLLQNNNIDNQNQTLTIFAYVLLFFNGGEMTSSMQEFAIHPFSPRERTINIQSLK